jgi:aminoglycoside phosphotransferase (APT) family kinase protein
MMNEDEQRRVLAEWLCARLPGATGVEIGGERRPTGSGFSAETVIFDATISAPGDDRIERFVLRKETPDPAVYPEQAQGFDVEIDIQFRVMKALGDSGVVPVAPLIGYESNTSIMGTPFFVMRYIDGVVPIENPLYTKEGFFVDASPQQRRTMIDNGLQVLAALHTIDWKRHRLEWLSPPGATPGTKRQLDVWEQYCRRELGDREHPVFEQGMAYLRANMPPDAPVGLCWGDARLGNMIWQDFKPVCVTDFEAACISTPEHDLGWWLMFDRWVHESLGAERLEGEPTRDEQRALYEKYAGRVVGDTYFHEVFAATRYTAIVVRVMNRTVARGAISPDQTIWLHNPATVCLEQLLAERA